MKQASWIARSPKKVHTVRSAKDLVRMCCCSRTFYLALDSRTIEVKYDQRILYQNLQLRRLIRVFARRTRRFVKPRDCRRHIPLAKALIRLLMCRIRVCRLIRLFVRFIVGFAMHRLMRDVFVQTITLSTLGKIFNRRHFLNIFLILPRKQDLRFMQIVSIAWNVKILFSW